MQRFVHVTFEHSKYAKLKTRQFYGNSYINTDESTVLFLTVNQAEQSYFALAKKVKSVKHSYIVQWFL